MAAVPTNPILAPRPPPLPRNANTTVPAAPAATVTTDGPFITINPASLLYVFNILKQYSNSFHLIFVSGQKVLSPSIEIASQEIIELIPQLRNSSPSGNKDNYYALLYLLACARVRDTELVNYDTLQTILRRKSPPRPPNYPKPGEQAAEGDSSNQPNPNIPFLPYLSFLCRPEKIYKVYSDEAIDGVRGSSYYYRNRDEVRNGVPLSVMPPHPTYLERPMPSVRNSYNELVSLLKKAASNNRVRYQQFSDAILKTDGSLSRRDIAMLFETAMLKETGLLGAMELPDAVRTPRGANQGSQKHQVMGTDSARKDATPRAKTTEGPAITNDTTVDVDVLLDVARPQLTLYRQKIRDSALVRRALKWPSNANAALEAANTGNKDASPEEQLTTTYRVTMSGHTPGLDSPRSLYQTYYGSGGTPNSGNASSKLTSTYRYYFGGPGGTASFSPRNGSRSPRAANLYASMANTPNLGGKTTRSAELRLSFAKDNQGNPNSPRYLGEYRYVEPVPESHYRRLKQNNIIINDTTRCFAPGSPRNTNRNLTSLRLESNYSPDNVKRYYNRLDNVTASENKQLLLTLSELNNTNSNNTSTRMANLRAYGDNPSDPNTSDFIPGGDGHPTGTAVEHPPDGEAY